jgi:hypothetical protein
MPNCWKVSSIPLQPAFNPDCRSRLVVALFEAVDVSTMLMVRISFTLEAFKSVKRLAAVEDDQREPSSETAGISTGTGSTGRAFKRWEVKGMQAPVASARRTMNPQVVFLGLIMV